MLSFEQVLEAMISRQLDTLLSRLSPSLVQQAKAHQQRVENRVAEVKSFVEQEMQDAPRGSRDEFASWVNTRYKDFEFIYAPYFFAAYDEIPLEPLIYKHEFHRKPNARRRHLTRSL